MAIQHENRANARRKISGDNVLQILGEYGAAHGNGTGERGLASALRQRPRSIRDHRRNVRGHALRDDGRDAHRDLNIDRKGQVRAVLLDGADGQNQHRLRGYGSNIFGVKRLEIRHFLAVTSRRRRRAALRRFHPTINWCLIPWDSFCDADSPSLFPSFNRFCAWRIGLFTPRG